MSDSNRHASGIIAFHIVVAPIPHISKSLDINSILSFLLLSPPTCFLTCCGVIFCIIFIDCRYFVDQFCSKQLQFGKCKTKRLILLHGPFILSFSCGFLTAQILVIGPNDNDIEKYVGLLLRFTSASHSTEFIKQENLKCFRAVLRQNPFDTLKNIHKRLLR